MSKRHLKTEELLYEKHFPFKLVLRGLRPFSCLLLIKVGPSGQSLIEIRKPPIEQCVSY